MEMGSESANGGAILTRIDLDNFDLEILKERRPVLLTCVRGEAGYKEQMEIVEGVSRAYVDKVKVCLLDEDFMRAFQEKLGVKGTPTFLVFRGGIEVGRMLGQASQESLKAFLVRFMPHGETVQR